MTKNVQLDLIRFHHQLALDSACQQARPLTLLSPFTRTINSDRLPPVQAVATPGDVRHG